MIVTSKDGIKNMLRVEVWKELRYLDDLIHNMTVNYQNEYFTYNDICAKWFDECFQNDILNLEYIMEEVRPAFKSVQKTSNQKTFFRSRLGNET